MKSRDKYSGLTAERLRDILDYNPDDGQFYWRELPHKSASNIMIGDIAGSKEKTGYIRITINGRRYVAHRLAWLYVYEEWPDTELDHIDGTRSNNRINNLRLATGSQNRSNSKTHANNHLGVKGVQIHRASGKYRARIFLNGKHISLGLFDNANDAANAYAEAAKRFFGEFARMS